MEVINKEFLQILVCPQCHSSLRIIKQHLICSRKSCHSSFLIKNKVPLLLSRDLAKDQDYFFKKAQMDFFDNWSSEKRGRKKAETSFDRFFSCVVGEKKINYSEEEMSSFVKNLPKNSLILELGCGAGEHTAFLSSLRKDIWLLAIDLSFKSILETKKRLSKQKNIKCQVDFMVADAEKLPLKNNSFDGVLAVMFFHHVASPQKSLREIKRIVKNEGKSLIVDLIGNNSFMVFSRRYFTYLPAFLKEKFKEDYLLSDGQTPEVKLHRIKEIKKIIKNLGFKVKKEDRYELFVSNLKPLVTIFPLLKYLFPEFFLNFLYNIERRLLKKRFFQKFAGAVSLWVSK